MRLLLRSILPYIPHVLICIGLMFFQGLWAEGVIGVANNSNLGNNSIVDPGNGDFIYSIQSVAIDVIYAIKIALNGVALLALLYVGFQWVTSMGDEEKQNDGKYRLLLIIMGLFLINIPELLYNIISGSSYLDDNFWRKVQTVSTRDPGGVFNESALQQCNYFFCAQNFWGNGTTIAIMKFLEILMIATAVVMFTWGGFMLMFRGNDEHASSGAKTRLVYGVIALIVIGFIEGFYRAIFFGGGLNTSSIMNTAVSIANFALFLAGPIAIIYLIIGAYFFITAGGNEERADRGKKILLHTFFATILLLLSYTFLVEIVGLNLF